MRSYDDAVAAAAKKLSKSLGKIQPKPKNKVAKIRDCGANALGITGTWIIRCVVLIFMILIYTFHTLVDMVKEAIDYWEYKL